MARRKKYNPERRAWKGVSYRRGRQRVRALREAARFGKSPGKCSWCSGRGGRHCTCA